MSVFWVLALVAVIIGVLTLFEIVTGVGALVMFVLAIALVMLGGGAPGWTVIGRKEPPS